MKISNLTSKTAIEIQDTDILVIEDSAETKKITVKEFRDYLMNNGITKSTKMLINEMMDSVIHSLQASKYVISELLTFKMNTVINDAASGDIFITLKDINTDKWLTGDEIKALLMPDADGQCGRDFIINVLVDDVYVKSASYSIHDASEVSDIVPEGNIGYIKAHFDLDQNQIAGITYDDIMITMDDTEVTFVLPIEDKHEYKFVGDPDYFNNRVPYVQNIG